ncbi:protein MCM10 homolog [Neodiprion virginianus]|uniref:protein MCM10 homolog n=1 Tax=Neodiprion virginianus TaxID=2961670 RepID=UPI001EE7746D|nr:protein MCM10 homolog [Neodiprion virginianus]
MASDNDSDVGDLLEDLLANDETEDADAFIQKSKPTESSLNFLEQETNIPSPHRYSTLADKKTMIHNGDTDSSDDEDKRDFENQNYSSSGREIKNILKSNASETNTSYPKTFKNTSGSFTKNHSTELCCPPDSTKTESKDIYCDPIFGLRIINPVVSSASLKERMTGRTPVTVSRIKYHLNTADLQTDWVIAGVLINKSGTRSSQKGNQYCIWKISDLSDGIKTVSLFLFGDAYKSFWKTNTGMVIGVLNPGVLDNKDENINEAALSVDNGQRIMILGVSKDMGVCKSKKKNGEPCTSIVNLHKCEYCIYHVQQEYNKCARRSDLQSSSNSRGVSTKNALQNKVLGKGETIYGGRSFTAVPAKRNFKMVEKDRARLELLQNPTPTRTNLQLSSNNVETKKKASLVELTSNQMKKDANRLAKLRGSLPKDQPSLPGSSTSSSLIISSSKTTMANSSPHTKPQLSFNKNSPVMAVPQLGVGLRGGFIDLSEPITKKNTDMAKMNAIKWIQRNGALKKNNPNKVRKTLDEKVELRGTKRQREITEDTDQASKKQTLVMNRFQEIMAATSRHTDLIEKSDEQEKEKYFSKLEIKEKMEDKMMSTYSIDCKAVKCLTCKYTAFSASDMCKDQKHPLRVTDAVKRFFKCGDCKNRTVTLDRLPSHSCKNCQSSNWIRTAMMDERKVEINENTLSIRGGEEKFIGSVVTNSSLNLLVPEYD